MKKLLIMLCLAVMSLPALAQDYKNYDDVIYGTDGSIVRGTIVEQIPGVSYKIATRDGNIFVYDALRVEKITKEAPIGIVYGSNGAQITRKYPFWSAVGSFFIPGLGQVINGQVVKGVWLFAGNVASIVTLSLGSVVMPADLSLGSGMIVLGALGLYGTYFYSLIQAPVYASRWNAQNGFAMGGDTWLKMEPSVGVSNTIATGTNATYGMKAVLTF